MCVCILVCCVFLQWFSNRIFVQRFRVFLLLFVVTKRETHTINIIAFLFGIYCWRLSLLRFLIFVTRRLILKAKNENRNVFVITIFLLQQFSEGIWMSGWSDRFLCFWFLCVVLLLRTNAQTLKFTDIMTNLLLKIFSPLFSVFGIFTRMLLRLHHTLFKLSLNGLQG